MAMNLIKDAWIPVVRADSGRGMIAPWQIVEQDNPVMELAAPRPDFQGAMYQFLIGLLQTCFAPENQDEWLEHWDKPPDANLLKARMEVLSEAFEFDNPNGPAFMQDFNLLNEKKNEEAISSLLIESPGSKTEKDNLDHFIKRGRAEQICHSCAAMALFALQINAPSGGNGHRVGVRGGGPLTTLVLPPERSILWKTLWLNVLLTEDLTKYLGKPTSDIFPWMGPTRVSNQKVVNGEKIYILNGVPTYPSDTHQLQVFWGMPRRIRIHFTNDAVGTCDLCAAINKPLVTEYYTGVWGVDYVGAWVHPLTPYSFDIKKNKPPISLKGQKGGLGYQHWLGLTLADDENGDRAALVVRSYSDQRARELHIQRIARLWCFGYDMDNMKARCWYDHRYPLFNLDPVPRGKLMLWATELVNAAQDVSNILHKQVKAAWFRRPEDAKGDMAAVSMDFWQRSETAFYGLLEQLAGVAGKEDNPPPGLYESWKNVLLNIPLQLFDAWVLEGPIEDMDMKRVIAERDGLMRLINGCKSMKTIKAKALPEKEESDGAKA
jgi:CRISPR system Cascade subunit CasA